MESVIRHGKPARQRQLVRSRGTSTAMLLLLLIASSAFCGTPTQDRNVSVLYAGSLATIMERGIGPAFVKASGYTYQGEAQGSLGAAQMVRDRLRTPDVFISADPLVNINL